MKNNQNMYQAFAEVLYYPGPDFGKKVNMLFGLLNQSNDPATEPFRDFACWAAATSEQQQQELFTRSFDVQAITTLDIGFVLFGDDYKRGELLVNLHRELREHGIDARGQLADNLPNVVWLLGALPEGELATDLARKILLPALEKMISEFDPERIEKKTQIYQKHQKTIIEKDQENFAIYRKALMSLHGIISTDFGTIQPEIPAQSMDFLKAISSEVNLEPMNS